MSGSAYRLIFGGYLELALASSVEDAPYALGGCQARAGGRSPRGLQFAVDGWLVAPVDAQGQYCRAMEITELPPTPLVLPAVGELVHIRTQQWALERWEGEDPLACQ
jgi:hypothetical protein